VSRVGDEDDDHVTMMKIMHSESIILTNEKFKLNYSALHILQKKIFVDIMKVTHNL
jgi:hypothetical protein